MSQEVPLPEPLHRLFDDGVRLRRSAIAPGYRVALALGSGAMLLLPLLYLGLLVGTVWGLHTYCTDYFGWVARLLGHTRLGWVSLLLAITPVAAGLAVLLALIKPIFARGRSRQQPLTLQSRDEPLFVAFVHRICHLLGAPAPREIRVDCRVNAAAEWQGSILRPGAPRLTLTLGLPLVAGLSTRQLAGVIAHEFGHFRQGGAMRLSAVVRGINAWFVRAVHGRDVWDAWLEECLESESGSVVFLAACARAAVGLVRLLLNALLHLGLAVSGFLLRQMEFDADLAEVEVAGSAAFAATSRRLLELGKGAEIAYREASQLWEGRMQLPDNLPLLIAQHGNRLGAHDRAKIEQELAGQATGWFDSHPATGRRIARAEDAGQPGLFEADAPAIDLLQNFANLGKFVSHIHYEDDLGLRVRRDILAPVAASPTARPDPVRTIPAPAPLPVDLKLKVPVWRGKPGAETTPSQPVSAPPPEAAGSSAGSAQ